MEEEEEEEEEETTVGKEFSLCVKKAMEILLPGRSGGPSLWGACRSNCIWSPQ